MPVRIRCDWGAEVSEQSDESVLRVGDRMRWSVELIRQVVQEAGPDGWTVAVEVDSITTWIDGTKIVSMVRVEGQ